MGVWQPDTGPQRHPARIAFVVVAGIASAIIAHAFVHRLRRLDVDVADFALADDRFRRAAQAGHHCAPPVERDRAGAAGREPAGGRCCRACPAGPRPRCWKRSGTPARSAADAVHGSSRHRLKVARSRLMAAACVIVRGSAIGGSGAQHVAAERVAYGGGLGQATGLSVKDAVEQAQQARIQLFAAARRWFARQIGAGGDQRAPQARQSSATSGCALMRTAMPLSPVTQGCARGQRAGSRCWRRASWPVPRAGGRRAAPAGAPSLPAAPARPRPGSCLSRSVAASAAAPCALPLPARITAQAPDRFGRVAITPPARSVATAESRVSSFMAATVGASIIPLLRAEGVVGGPLVRTPAPPHPRMAWIYSSQRPS